MSATAEQPRVIRPQKGLQEAFLSSSADVAISGGSAGCGKTFALLLEQLRHVANPHFGSVMFRRTYPQITNEGGLWDGATDLYPLLGRWRPEFVKGEMECRFPSGMVVSFRHMQYGQDRFSWTGSQIPLISFDQLEEFEADQFWYMFSRNRSATAGVRPYIRGTCNPVPETDRVGGWLHRLLQWWIDPETGLAIPERSGVIRWFIRTEEKLHWGATAKELTAAFGPGEEPKSLTFIPGTLEDNPALTTKDPSYRGSLMALPSVDRQRLLGGNWNVVASAGKILNRAWFQRFLPAVPKNVKQWVRYFDKAGTEGGGKYTAGALVGQTTDGRFVIADMVRGQWSAGNREAVIKQTAQFDRSRGNVVIWVEQEPGSGGKESAENTVRNLAGFDVHLDRVTGDKVTRAGPFSAQAEAKNVDLVVGPWNEDFLVEAQNFDGVHGYSDQIDAAAGAFNKLVGETAFAFAVS